MREFRSLCEDPGVVSAVKGYDRKIKLEPFYWKDLIGDESPNLFKLEDVFDKITSIRGISNLQIDKSLILAARNSYANYVEAKKAKKAADDELANQAQLKRKGDAQVKELLKKKAKLLEDAQKQADLLSEEIKNLQKYATRSYKEFLRL
ncbi:hypothetical protein JTE90_010152 [Oedothorax gibbosus]|uniref:Uncharacterized protein n=1 Tax=Oedothorax gibbosus TaxID=931172 RepID=A0AAV6TUA7_9ARAC|nr:hypothetical protein JTE90_010152 [Oedothorax gibbosus]